jgi:two-component system, LuxR family, response regulator FixJ
MNSQTPAMVHFVDDDPGMRNSLLMLAQSASLPARAYASAEEFLAGMPSAAECPGCLVLDLRMPGIGGIELLQRLRTALNDIPVILISAHADVPDAIRGMKLGAVDLLQKPMEPTALLEAVQRSLELSQHLHRQRAEAESVTRRFANLTARELQLLQLIVDGHSNKQIASQMGISIKTVANHRASLMAKTEAINAADLARLFTLYKANQSQQSQSPTI